MGKMDLQLSGKQAVTGSSSGISKSDQLKRFRPRRVLQ